MVLLPQALWAGARREVAANDTRGRGRVRQRSQKPAPALVIGAGRAAPTKVFTPRPRTLCVCWPSPWRPGSAICNVCGATAAGQAPCRAIAQATGHQHMAASAGKGHGQSPPAQSAHGHGQLQVFGPGQ